MTNIPESHSDRYRRKMIECLRKATRLTPEEYGDEPCFWDGAPVEDLGGFVLGGLEEVAELADATERERPSWVWAVKMPRTMHLDADDVVELDHDNLHHEAVESIGHDAIAALQVLLDDWCARKDVQDATRSWDEDRSRVIVLDAARFEEEIASE